MFPVRGVVPSKEFAGIDDPTTIKPSTVKIQQQHYTLSIPSRGSKDFRQNVIDPALESQTGGPATQQSFLNRHKGSCTFW